MALGSKAELVRQAHISLFGVDYESRLRKVPEEEYFPQQVKHFDTLGVQYLPQQLQTITVSNGQSEAEVTLSFAVCQNCGAVFSKVEDIRFVLEYQPTQSGQALIHGLVY